MASYSSVDRDEIAKFSALGQEWWNPHGKMRPLHQMNTVRTEFVMQNAAKHFGFERDGNTKPLSGLTVLDVGCGGGIFSEPLARLGATVTGIDASAENIEIAKNHAKLSGLEINYICTTAEDLAAKGETYNLVTSMEVLEHVEGQAEFIKTCASLVARNGGIALSTLNRTAKSYAMAIVGAEYILRMLPTGTHDWKKFVKPSELARWLRASGMEMLEASGVSYNPITSEWSLVENLDVNYLAWGVKR